MARLSKPGRKSAAELAVAAPLAKVDRPEPPYELWRDEEVAVWRRIVSDVPADWFSPRNLDLLAEYCSHVVSSRRIAQMIKMIESEKGKFDVQNWMALLRAHAQQTGRVQALATSMRLSQQSTYSPKRGANALDGNSTGPKPWEYKGGE